MNPSFEKNLLDKKNLLKEMKLAAINNFNKQFLLIKEEEGLAITMQHNSPIDIDTWDIRMTDLSIYTNYLYASSEYVGPHHTLMCDFIIENKPCTLFYETGYIQADNYSNYELQTGFTLDDYVYTEVDVKDDDSYEISTIDLFRKDMDVLHQLQNAKNEFDSLTQKCSNQESFSSFLNNHLEKITLEGNSTATVDELLQIALYSVLRKTGVSTFNFNFGVIDSKNLYTSNFIEKSIEVETFEKLTKQEDYCDIVKDIRYIYQPYQEEQHIDIVLNTPNEITFKVVLSSL